MARADEEARADWDEHVAGIRAGMYRPEEVYEGQKPWGYEEEAD